MSLDEIFSAMWRRRVAFVLVLAAAFACAFAYLEVTDPVYEAESTLAVAPGSADELAFFSTIDAIIPIYADAAAADVTRAMAEAEVDEPIGRVSVQTFPESSLFKVRVRDTDPRRAAEGAQAVAEALIERATPVTTDGTPEVGVKGLVLSQIDRPQTPSEPVVPRADLTLVVAGVVGAGLAAAASLALDRQTRTVEDRPTVEAVAGAPVMATVPRERAVTRFTSPDALFSDPDLRLLAEAMRDLRTNLTHSRRSPLVILVTSPQGRHGKTTVAAALAATCATFGARTLLVDGDLRRGRLAEMFGEESSPGLSEVLLEDVSFTRAVRPTSLSLLHIITAGQLLEEPTDLIAQRARTVLALARSSYDIVVVDSTPLVPINDARLTAEAADVVLLVVAVGGAQHDEVADAVDRLRLVGVELSAVVLNRSRAPLPGSYYSYLAPPASGGNGRARRFFNRSRTR